MQSLQLTSTDFAALAALVSRLQDDDGLLVSGMSFSVSPETRRKAEDALTREAIRSWQQRAATAADALGYASWRTGRVTVSTGDARSDAASAKSMMRAQAAAAGGAPVAVEGGTTELTVTVTGDAMLDNLEGRADERVDSVELQRGSRASRLIASAIASPSRTARPAPTPD